MVLETVASGAVALLSPYLAKAGAKFAEMAGETLAGKAEELYKAIQGKFGSDAYASKTLERARKEPESKSKMGAVGDVLIEQMRADEAFANRVGQILNEARNADSRDVIWSGERSVVIGNDATGNIIITGDQNKVGPDQH